MTHKCATANCMNQLEGNKKYCDDCITEFKSRQGPTPEKAQPYRAFQFEEEMLKGAVGSRVELQMSRGPPVKGTLRAFDLQYAKLAVEEDLGESSRTTIVRLGYVSAFSIFKPNKKKD